MNNKEFKTFDRVIVREGDDCSWSVAFFSNMWGDRYVVAGGLHYKQCLPYEGNEDLLGTYECPKPKKWRAERGEVYWYVGTDAVAVNDTDDDHYSENSRYLAGNYFRTQEEAEAMAAKIKELLNDEEEIKKEK